MMKVVCLVRCTDLVVNVTGCSALGLSSRTTAGGSGLLGGLSHRLCNKANWPQLSGTRVGLFFCEQKLMFLYVECRFTQKRPHCEFKGNQMFDKNHYFWVTAMFYLVFDHVETLTELLSIT